MANIRISVTVLVLLTFLASCRSRPKIEHFNEETWKNDKNGCKGLRLTEVQAILKARKSLQGEAELNLIKTMGKADEIRMYKRNVKNLIYFLEPGSQCGAEGKTGKKLIVELNALGYVTWIYEDNL